MPCKAVTTPALRVRVARRGARAAGERWRQAGRVIWLLPLSSLIFPISSSVQRLLDHLPSSRASVPESALLLACLPPSTQQQQWQSGTCRHNTRSSGTQHPRAGLQAAGVLSGILPAPARSMVLTAMAAMTCRLHRAARRMDRLKTSPRCLKVGLAGQTLSPQADDPALMPRAIAGQRSLQPPAATALPPPTLPPPACTTHFPTRRAGHRHPLHPEPHAQHHDVPAGGARHGPPGHGRPAHLHGAAGCCTPAGAHANRRPHIPSVG